MGFNTTVLVLNDALENIKNDPEAGKKIVEGINRAVSYNQPITVPIGHYGNPVLIIESHHADLTTIVAVGANYAHHRLRGAQENPHRLSVTQPEACMCVPIFDSTEHGRGDGGHNAAVQALKGKP